MSLTICRTFRNSLRPTTTSPSQPSSLPLSSSSSRAPSSSCMFSLRFRVDVAFRGGVVEHRLLALGLVQGGENILHRLHLKPVHVHGRLAVFASERERGDAVRLLQQFTQGGPHALFMAGR